MAARLCVTGDEEYTATRSKPVRASERDDVVPTSNDATQESEPKLNGGGLLGTVYRKTVTRPLPKGAELFTRQGQQFADKLATYFGLELRPSIDPQWKGK